MLTGNDLLFLSLDPGALWSNTCGLFTGSASDLRERERNQDQVHKVKAIGLILGIPHTVRPQS